MKVKSLNRVRLFATPWTVTYQAPPSLEFSRWGYWSGLPFPSPGDLPDPGIKPGSPTLQADTLPSEPPGKTLLKAKFCSKREEFSTETQMTCNFILGFPGGTKWLRTRFPLQEIWETQVWSLGWEDPLEEGMATHSCILAGESHGQRSLAGYSPRVTQSQNDWSDLARSFILVSGV